MIVHCVVEFLVIPTVVTASFRTVDYITGWRTGNMDTGLGECVFQCEIFLGQVRRAIRVGVRIVRFHVNCAVFTINLKFNFSKIC